MQFWTCPNCGENLDFGERHRCSDEKEAAPLQPGTAPGSAGRTGHTRKTSVSRFSGSVKEGFAYG